MSMMDEFMNEFKIHIENSTIKDPSRWAEKRRIMGNPFPGNYSLKLFPWCRELHDSKASWNVSMKSAQAGFTEVGINLALYTIDVLKKNVLYVLPTAGDASDFSRSRFNPALRMSPYLKNVFTDANNVRLKMAGNVSLYIRGSKGDSNLRSLPVSVLILDELDDMDQSQIELALQRLRGQTEKKVWYISTPTTPDHGVSLEYSKSSQENFRFKCPGCNKMDQFIFPESLKICGEDFNDPDCHKSYYQCTMCGYQYKHFIDTDNKFRQDDKLATLCNTGIWEPTIKEYDPDRRGFSINQLYSYTVAPFEITQDYFKSLVNPYADQEFHKSVLGQPFIGENSQVTDELLTEATKSYKCKQFSLQPGDDRMITLGIDQGKWSYYVVAEWFYDRPTYDINTHAHCRILDVGKFYEEDWEVIPPRLMNEWMIRACMVDADPSIQIARVFARSFKRYVWLNRYREGKVGKEMAIDDDNSFAPIATVDKTNWFDISLGRFFKETIEIPYNVPEEFRNHIKNLYRKYDEDKDGNPTARYKNYGPDHYAHALNYAEMALPCACSFSQNKDIKNFL